MTTNDIKVSQRHLDLARSMGACEDSLAVRIGTPLARVPREDVEWMESIFPAEAAHLAWQIMAGYDLAYRGSPPLSMLVDGYRDVAGYDDTCGDSSGHSSGYGYGDGAGSGDGHGHSYSSGYGYPDGSGHAYGEP